MWRETGRPLRPASCMAAEWLPGKIGLFTFADLLFGGSA